MNCLEGCKSIDQCSHVTHWIYVSDIPKPVKD